MNDKLPQRKEIRLKNFDYGESGFYFITICSKEQTNVFGEVEDTRNIRVDLQIAPNLQEDTMNIGFNDPWRYSLGMPHVKLSEFGKIILENILYIKNFMNLNL